MKIYIVVTDVVNDVTYSHESVITRVVYSILFVWSYDFYDMTLSTGKQRRHMIKVAMTYCHYMSSVMRKPTFCICENISSDQLISAFVFATWTVQCLCLNLKFPATSHLLYLHTSVCVGPVRKFIVGFLMSRLICVFQS